MARSIERDEKVPAEFPDRVRDLFREVTTFLEFFLLEAAVLFLAKVLLFG